MFLVVEGPNAVGKTTVSAALVAHLRREHGDLAVHGTREPSDSKLGRSIRAMNNELKGHALALACAADRFDHYEREVAPALAAGRWVVSDRYVPSSLVLQRLDGLDIASIWAINETAVRPDLTVYLEDAAQVIATRLAERPGRTRLEGIATPEHELALYRDTRAFLSDRGWRDHVVDCSGRTPEQIASRVSSVLEC